MIVILLHVLTKLGYALNVYVKEKRECNFENALVKNIVISTNLK